jgi:DNA-directed RNA polymerase specialized sigma24 family protein
MTRRPIFFVKKSNAVRQNFQWRVAAGDGHSRVSSVSEFANHPFPNTHWSLVQRAGLPDVAARREALGILLARYEPALKSYLMRTWRVSQDTAEELVQAFVSDRILEHDLLQNASQGRGRFRALLVTCLRNFTISWFRSRQVRGTVPLSANMESRNDASPEKILDTAWARALVGSVLQAMKDECRRTNRFNVWIVFEARLLAAAFENSTPTSYEDLASQLGLTSPVQAANLLVTAKRTYARLLRAAVAEYESDPSRIDDEISDLREILAESLNACGD